MPLRDHFHPPLSDTRRWDSLLGQWPAMIVIDLNTRLSSAYTAAPSVHLGVEFEIDVAVSDEERAAAADFGSDASGGFGTAVWAPPKPTLELSVDLDKQDEYEFRVYNRENRVVAAIEIVSPANKDRPEHRTAFATKCAALMQQGSRCLSSTW